jgi:hypothetical protein
MFVYCIYNRFTKSFILVVDNGLSLDDVHAFSLFIWFHAQHTQFMELYNIGRPTTLLVKNIGNFAYGEQ